MQIFSRFFQDAVHAFRVFQRHRSGVVVAVAGLGLSLGLGTAVVAVVNSLLFPPLGVSNPEFLFWIRPPVERPSSSERGFSFQAGWSSEEFMKMRELADGVQVAAVIPGVREILTEMEGLQPEAPVTFVSAEFFSLVGAKATIGRLFNSTDEHSNASSVVLSYDAWSRWYGRSPAVLGRTITIGKQPTVIIGVTERAFVGPLARRPSVWLPSKLGPAAGTLGSASPLLLVRNATPIDRQRIQSLAESVLTSGVGRRPLVEPGRLAISFGSVTASRSDAARTVMPMLGALLGAVALVGLLNLAGFLVVVATARQREMGIRVALGASRGSLARQLLTESILLGVAASITGLGVSAVLIPVLKSMVELPVGTDVVATPLSYTFLIATGTISCVLAGLAPARFIARFNVSADLAGNSNRLQVLPTPERFRAILIAGQVALSVLLLVVSGLLTRGALRSQSLDIGFDVDRLLSLSIRTVGGDWTARDPSSYLDDAFARLENVAGVESASAVQYMFGGSAARGQVEANSRLQNVALNRSTSEYFRTAGIPVLRGRSFSQQETDFGTPVVVISESVAARLWGLDSAVGRTLAIRGQTASTATVIGVVGDVMNSTIEEMSEPIGTVYAPLYGDFLADAKLVVRSRGDARTLKPQVEAAIAPIVFGRSPRFTSLGALVDAQVSVVQIPARLTRLAGTVVLLLTLAGLHSLVALVVRQRFRDIAVRAVLGAGPMSIASFTAGFALRPAASGLVVGSLLSIPCVHVLSSILLGVPGYDPVVLLVVIGGLALILALGVAHPVAQAIRVQPASILKSS